MLIKKSLLGVAIVAASFLTGCGGGAGSTAGTSGGNSSALATNEVFVGTKTVTAGSSIAISAHAAMRAATPSSMVWTVTPLTPVMGGDLPPEVNDPKCTGASYSPPLFSNATGEGTCNAILTFNSKLRTSTWRITNTASASSTSGSGPSVSNFVDVTVNALPESGFRLVESSVPAIGYVNKQLTLNVPFTVNPGSSVKNINYTWLSASTNPAEVPIAGSRNSSATVTPTVAGQYRWDVRVTAEVNGFSESATASVVASVYPPNVADVIEAGIPQIVIAGDIVKLTGTILNQASDANYTYSWAQLPGAEGGPSTITVNNANSPVASFVAPTTTGSYGFVFNVTKTQPDGSKAITQSQTSVIVQAAPAGVFNVSAGAAQTVAVGSVATMTGTVGTQGNANGVTYQYQWSQVGVTPAVVTLSNAQTDKASFIPGTAGAYTFNLTVTATTKTGVTTVSGQTTVLATTSGSGSAGTFAMTANSGPTQAVPANAVATLTGSQVTQGNSTGVTYAYAWTQQGALPAAVVLSNANTAVATFLPTVGGVYTFRLTVTATLSDGSTRTATSDSQVVVGGVGNAFSVSAGNAQSVASGTAAVMTGSVTTQGSYAGATFTYVWTQTGASPTAVTVSNANSLIASIVPTVSGTYTFLLTVTANNGGSTSTQTATTQVLVP